MSVDVRTALSMRRPAVVGAACAGALLLGAVGGLWAAAGVGEPESASRAAAPATRAVRVGPARVEVPRTWETVRAGATRVVLAPLPPLRDRVTLTVAPADHTSLIARPVRARLEEISQAPLPVELAGHPAWYYGSLVDRAGREALDVTVLPGRDAVLTVTCSTPVSDGRMTPDCAADVAAVSIGRGPTLVPAPDLALGLTLPAVLGDLDDRRRDARAALAGARSPATQERLARQLATAHDRAAGRLRSVAGAAGAPLVEQLSATAHAYRALADGIGTTSAVRLRALRRELRVSEDGLERAVDAVGQRPILAAAPAPRAPARPATADTPGWLLPVAVLCAALVFVLVTAALRRPRAPGASAAPGPITPPVAAPGPARWDAPPEDADRLWSATT